MVQSIFCWTKWRQLYTSRCALALVGKSSIMSSRVAAALILLGLCCLLNSCGDSQGQLLAQLQSPEVEVRRAAVRALALQSQPDNRVMIALTQAVADSDQAVRGLAINALGQIGKPARGSLPALTLVMKDSDPVIRLRAALAIQKINPKDLSFVPVLVSAMRSGDGRVLLEVGAMGRDGAWAVPTLIELLGHPLPQIRALAAQTLGRIGPAAVGAKPALQQAAHDSNAAVQLAARQALEHVQAESKGPDK
jgi:HEAT repeat protein